MTRSVANFDAQPTNRSSAGRRSAIVILVVSLMSVCGAVAATLIEVRPYTLLTAYGVERWQEVRGGTIEPGLSLQSSRATLNSCLSAMTSVYGRLRPAKERLEVATNCGGFAEASAAIMPSNSYAWYIASLAAVQNANTPKFEENWLLSAKTGQNEQWIAGLRVALLEDHFDLASPVQLEAERHDLAVLVMSKVGIGSIARRYVSQPGFRERVVSVVETLPEADQARFVAAVTQEANSSGMAR